ncbi:hypothetical protein TNCV_3090121 [Trichonephila clavipes]|nr:hypothetical protein TNCV_3090121 [Trichonephila clavipes]
MTSTIPVSHAFGFFCPWGIIKELVFSDKETTQTDLVARLHAACTSVDSALLQPVQSSISQRAQTYLDMHGRHFEHQPF